MALAIWQLDGLMLKVFKLIEVWSEEEIQEQLEGLKRNKHIYEKLSSKLRKDGYNKTGEQCRSKVKKLRPDYKKIKDNNGLTGRGRGKWRFYMYEALDDILGNRPATRPPVIVDTTKDLPPTSPPTDPVVESPGEDKDESDKEEVNEDIEKGEESSSSDSNCKNDGKKIRKRKRKRGRAEVEGVVTNVMKKITKSLSEADKMFIRLEEKRMEYEAQQRREERQFQLQLAQTLAGQSSSPYNYSYPTTPPQYYHPQPVPQPPQHYYPDTNKE